MPDWSYQPIFRPLLFRLAPARARRWTLKAIGAVARAPGGAFVIRTLGHLETPEESALERWGLRFDCPIGLGGEVDPHGEAQRALAQFGFGYLEVGPISERATPPTRLARDDEAWAVAYGDRQANDGVEAIERRLRREGDLGKPRFLRLRHDDGASPEAAAAQYARLAARLAPHAAAFTLDAYEPDEERFDRLVRAADAVRSACPEKPLLLYVPPDAADADGEALAREAVRRWDGLVLGSAVGDPASGWRSGAPAKAATRRAVAAFRERLPAAFPIVAAGGVMEPADAVALRRAGADLIELNAGLVFAGPGLAKRSNEALTYEAIRGKPAPRPPTYWAQWGWLHLLGLAMIAGGLIAWFIAATTVVLPYDERFLGTDREAIREANERLLPFMSHDRVTLAGTMISIGILYAYLARHGLRRRLHWARTAALTSGTVGFSGFFLYLGYGYFDPLHATVSAALLPMFVLAMRDGKDEPSRMQPNLNNDRRWRLALFGQLAFVCVGVGLAAGGLAIAGVGVTQVFVPSDLAFLDTRAEHLHAVNPRLLPLIAHDRAGFGGALLADALAVLITALWGIGQGERWIWRMLLLAGIPGFAAGLGVHAAIGYVDVLHLLPVYLVLALYVIGLICLYPYLHARPSEAVATPTDARGS